MIWWWERKLWTVITIKKRAWGTGKAEKSGNVNNILETNKESEDEDSYSNLKSLIQKLDKDEEIEGGGGGVYKDLADIANKVRQNTNAFEKLKAKIKT